MFKTFDMQVTTNIVWYKYDNYQFKSNQSICRDPLKKTLKPRHNVPSIFQFCRGCFNDFIAGNLQESLHCQQTSNANMPARNDLKYFFARKQFSEQSVLVKVDPKTLCNAKSLSFSCHKDTLFFSIFYLYNTSMTVCFFFYKNSLE